MPGPASWPGAMGRLARGPASPRLYAALQAAVAAEDWPRAVALAGEIPGQVSRLSRSGKAGAASPGRVERVRGTREAASWQAEARRALGPRGPAGSRGGRAPRGRG